MLNSDKTQELVQKIVSIEGVDLPSDPRQVRAFCERQLPSAFYYPWEIASPTQRVQMEDIIIDPLLSQQHVVLQARLMGFFTTEPENIQNSNIYLFDSLITKMFSLYSTATSVPFCSL